VLTRARRDGDGDEWIVNGQKVWTTGAQFSDYGLLLARTDPTLPKHAGLTMFFVDMKSAGIEVRPIRQMAGESEFNEVFFTDLRVPDHQRLGAVGAGWKVALTTLMHERLSVGAEIGLLNFDALWTVVQEAGQLQDPLAIEQLAEAWVAEEGLRLHQCRTLTALSRGGVPGPEQSIAKLVKASLAQRMANFAIELQGEAGQLGCDDPTSSGQAVERAWAWSAAMRIAGGTDEILRNIIAERVLGLPEEARQDKGIPFNEVPR
jgi:acyl-CoA dehydrogenase